jgi:Arc/MetJ family transcription regulator
MTGVSTKRELIDLALRGLIRSRRKKDLFDLAGKIQFADDYDPFQEIHHKGGSL